MQNVDLKQHALNLLELSREFLSKDGDLDSTAFIITADDQLLREIDLRDESRKLESCIKIVDEARRQNALAIITIFLARFKDFASEDFNSDAYCWGDLQQEGSERCILVTLSGPGIKNWAVALPFKTERGRIVFQQQSEFTNLDLGLFPGWSEPVTHPRVS